MKECAHEACRCTVDGEEFCGAYCKERGSSLSISSLPPDPLCRCGHPPCRAGEEPRK